MPINAPISAAQQTPELAPAADARTIARQPAENKAELNVRKNPIVRPGAIQPHNTQLPPGTPVRVKLKDGTYAGNGAVGRITGYVEGKRPRVRLQT